MKPLTIHIANSSEDESYYKEIKTAFGALIQNGMVVITNHSDVKGGQVHREVIAKMVKDCDIYMPLISSDFVSEDNLGAQYDWVEEESKPIWAVLIRNTFSFIDDAHFWVGTPQKTVIDFSLLAAKAFEIISK